MQAPYSIALAGGGTGGHLVPGLHILRRLVERGSAPGSVLWFGAGRAVEDRVLAGLDEAVAGARTERITLHLEPPGGGAPSLAGLLARTPGSVLAARRALRRHQSGLLLGLGGFTTLPAVLAARTLGIPVFLLEINAVPGRATRHLAPLATRVFHAWPSTLPADPGLRHLHVGPPLAPEFLGGPPTPALSRAARGGLGFDPDRPLVVVLGGSQGALGLNRFLREHAAVLVEEGVQVLHQCGPGRGAEGPAPAPGLRVVEYLDDVPRALSAATLVLSRGGASTLAELAALARPTLVVPYPHHADRHQERNARLLGEGVRIVPEESLDAGFAAELVRLASPSGDSERAAMERALAGKVPSDASERIARELAG
ncbi:MAG TPA: UDP-N-acetylglucosamine--N-acetylmuramyl-(pentapeptide) pyrophosphoryl-undecaprenol N-acetylglucosamine transferase [Planctomycetes bacterium]|nr:UDP-N-acetylglucosamine--N-acetylmuramyl-(pentapeptide) pyrophosphoryl-undecaprenol N-acetylglucosamine transferase [Planctomycetota bacterium]